MKVLYSGEPTLGRCRVTASIDVGQECGRQIEFETWGETYAEARETLLRDLEAHAKDLHVALKIVEDSEPPT